MIVTIHATMTKAGVNLTLADLSVADRKSGLSRVGWHYVICRDGRVETGRPLSQPSPHAPPPLGKDVVAVVLVGGLNRVGEPSNTNFTNDQREALKSLLASLPSPEVRSMTPAFKGEELQDWLRG